MHSVDGAEFSTIIFFLLNVFATVPVFGTAIILLTSICASLKSNLILNLKF